MRAILVNVATLFSFFLVLLCVATKRSTCTALLLQTITFMQRQAQYSPHKASAVPEAIQQKQKQACVTKARPAVSA